MNNFFTKSEGTVVAIIFLTIFIISAFQYGTALRRGRDNERENDLGDIAKLLDAYKNKNAYYPSSLASLGNAPKDPLTSSGYAYLYLTDGRFYQVYASLEGGRDESQYIDKVAKLGLKCGNYICNFGRASGNLPLDKSIQEYENELYAAQKNEK